MDGPRRGAPPSRMRSTSSGWPCSSCWAWPAFLLAQRLLVPAEFGKYGHYRPGALEDRRNLPLVFAGRAACEECHTDIAETKSKGKHARPACEACHGPLATHAADPSVKPTRPDGRTLCLRCHSALVGRPASFPQSTWPSTPPRACARSATRRTIPALEEPHDGRPPRVPLLHGKLLSSTGTAAAASSTCWPGRTEAAPGYARDRSLVGDDHRHRQVHRLRQLRARPARRRTTSPASRILPHLGRALPRGPQRHRAPVVDSPNGGFDGFPERYTPGDGSQELLRAQAVQPLRRLAVRAVCPVGATFRSRDGVVLWTRTTAWLPLLRPGLPLRCRFIDPRTSTSSTSATCATTGSPRAHHRLRRACPTGPASSST
jgi:predicted CXXCH cytochrome family protein